MVDTSIYLVNNGLVVTSTDHLSNSLVDTSIDHPSNSLVDTSADHLSNCLGDFALSNYCGKLHRHPAALSFLDVSGVAVTLR